MNKMVTWVDPPEGWRYGFPAILEKDEPLEHLLIKHKYPETLFTLALNHSRYWTEVD